MPAALPNPFIDAENRFTLDEAQFLRDIAGADALPVFITDPSPDFIAAMHRDVLPLLEDAVRRSV